jgi:hypothetical protein
MYMMDKKATYISFILPEGSLTQGDGNPKTGDIYSPNINGSSYPQYVDTILSFPFNCTKNLTEPLKALKIKSFLKLKNTCVCVFLVQCTKNTQGTKTATHWKY